MPLSPVPAAVGEIWEVRISATLQEQEYFNVLHFQSLAGDTDVYTHLLQAMAACVISTLLPGLPSSFTFNFVDGKRIEPTIGPSVELVPDANQQTAGAIATDSLPSFNACKISKRTATGGRHGRGRIFLPCPPEASTTGSYINIESGYWQAVAAFIACIGAHFLNLSDPPASGQWLLGVYQRAKKVNGAVVTPSAFHGCTDLIPSRLVTTQKSRQIGRGR